MNALFSRDWRFALRTLAKRPAASAVAIISLAIGLGANATIFSFVSALLLRPLPVTQPDRLVEVWHHRAKSANSFMSYMTLSHPDYSYYRDHNQSFQTMGAFVPEPRKVSWLRNGEGQTVYAQLVSENFFNVVGVKPVRGRFFTAAPEEPGIVLGYSLWKRLGADPRLIGASWNLNGGAFRVLGVAPEGLNGLSIGSAIDVWLPLRDERQIGAVLDRENRRMHALIGLGRLKPGITLDQAKVEMTLLGRRIAVAFPDSNKDTDGGAFPAEMVPGPMRKFVAMFSALLMTVMTLVLLIGCANAANILLAQASGRTRETAVRAALGASRARLVLQFLNESFVIALLAGAAGYAAAAFAAPLLLELRPANLPLEMDVHPDWRVAVFVFGCSLLTGVVFGLLPALRGSKLNLAEAMKSGGRGAAQGSSRLRNALIVAQVAVCVVLLVAGSLCVRSLQAARGMNPGFNPEHVFVSSLELRPFGYTQSTGSHFYRDLLDRLASSPGAQSVSLTDHLPLGTRIEMTMIQVPGVQPPRDAAGWAVEMAVVAPGYFKTMETPLLRGREFEWHDTPEAPRVIVINENMARQFWKGENAIGRQIQIREPGHREAYQVVGVVQNGKYQTLGEPVKPFLYFPLTQRYADNVMAVVRTAGEPAAFAATFRETVRSLDSRLALFDMGSMRQQLEFAFFTTRITGVLLGVAGLLALVLALAGVYGVISYVVAQRTRDIGVRMALGATDRDVLRMLLRYSLSLTGLGVGFGLLMALAATRVLAGLLYGIGPSDAVTFAGVGAGLMLLALAATWLPARRAMRINPLDALRYD